VISEGLLTEEKWSSGGGIAWRDGLLDNWEWWKIERTSAHLGGTG